MTNELKKGKRMKKNKYIRMSVVIMMGIMCVSGMPSNAYAIENNAEISDGNVLRIQLMRVMQRIMISIPKRN